MSVRLYVGNLPNELENQELEAAFAEAGEGVSTKLVTDRKTGKCRGFGFVTVEDESQVDAIIEKYNGITIRDVEIKVEKAQPRTEPAGSSKAAGGGAKEGGGTAAKKRGGAKQRGPAAVSSGGSDSIQPDPRWASELEKLKAMLAQNS